MKQQQKATLVQMWKTEIELEPTKNAYPNRINKAAHVTPHGLLFAQIIQV